MTDDESTGQTLKTPLPAKRKFLRTAAIAVPVVTVAAVLAPIIANWGNLESSTDALVPVPKPSPGTTSPAHSAKPTTPTVFATESSPEDSTASDAEGSILEPVAEPSVIGSIAAPGDLLWWRIPASAPLGSFPDDPSQEYWSGCTAEQLAWLDEHALPDGFDHSFDISIRNSASSGGALALVNLRFIADEVQPVPSVAFQCFIDEAGGDFGSQPIVIDTDGTAGTWGEPLSDGGPHEGEGSLATVNLSPGEAAELAFSRAEASSPRQQAQGRVVADLIGDDTSIVLAENAFFRGDEEVPLIAYNLDGDTGSWSLWCAAPDSFAPCTLAEAGHLLTSMSEVAGSE